MQELYAEGVASHGGPEPCPSVRNERWEALARGAPVSSAAATVNHPVPPRLLSARPNPMVPIATYLLLMLPADHKTAKGRPS
jgi:hypothetical protein